MPSIKDCLLAVYNLLKPVTAKLIPATANPALPLTPEKTLLIVLPNLDKLLNPVIFPRLFNWSATPLMVSVASSTALIVTLTSLSAILSPPFLIKKIGTIH